MFNCFFCYTVFSIDSGYDLENNLLTGKQFQSQSESGSRSGGDHSDNKTVKQKLDVQIPNMSKVSL